MAVDVHEPANSAVRQGVILAAGIGSRLATRGERSSVKSLIRLREIPLLLRTLLSLEIAWCEEVVVVLGHEAAHVREEIEACYSGAMRLTFVVNPNYQLKNGLSVLSARPHVGDAFILSMADHLLDDAIMRLVRHHRPPAGGGTLCVDFKIDSIFDLDDATKVQEKDGLIQAIGKDLTRFNCIDTGVFICTGALMDALEQIHARRGDASLSEGVQQIADQGRMQVLDIEDGFWQDVDTPEMLAHAESVLACRGT